jgi:hypothetical protein
VATHSTISHQINSSLLQEFDDVFPDDIPGGSPPLRGIEHQICVFMQKDRFGLSKG